MSVFVCHQTLDNDIFAIFAPAILSEAKDLNNKRYDLQITVTRRIQ